MEHIGKTLRKFAPRKSVALAERDLELHWRKVHPGLATLDPVKFRHMRVCCPYCEGQGAGCEWCTDTGLCCPVCRGLGWLGKWRPARASTMTRCTTCHIELSDGWEFDARAAMRAIEQYIDDWFEGRVIDEVQAREEENDAIRKAVEERRGPIRTWKYG